MTTASMSALVSEAQATARALLADDHDRLEHVRAAGLIAAVAADALEADQPETIVAAAWLHDIGYAPAVSRTGFHPLDGALYLARMGWPDPVVCMVAHHSHAAVLAPYYGVQHHLALMDHVRGHADDIITYSDLRAGIDGRGSAPGARIDDMRRRHVDRTFVPEDIREARYRMLTTAAARVHAAVAGRAIPGIGSSEVTAHAS